MGDGLDMKSKTKRRWLERIRIRISPVYGTPIRRDYEHLGRTKTTFDAGIGKLIGCVGFVYVHVETRYG